MWSDRKRFHNDGANYIQIPQTHTDRFVTPVWRCTSGHLPIYQWQVSHNPFHDMITPLYPSKQLAFQVLTVLFVAFEMVFGSYSLTFHAVAKSKASAAWLRISFLLFLPRQQARLINISTERVPYWWLMMVNTWVISMVNDGWWWLIVVNSG